MLYSTTFRRLAAAITSGACLAGIAMATLAQPYPTRPIRLIVTASAGGPSDMLARTLATKLGELLPEPVVVENRAGGGGTIAYESVAKAASDGYTLLLGEIANSAVKPSLYKSLPYDTRKDFTPIGPVAAAATFLFASASLPARNLQELIALAKSKPGQLSYGSSGTGTLLHIAAELFSMKNGLDTLHVPYKGATPAVVDVVAGRISFVMTAGLGTVKPHLDSGKVRALAVTGLRRSAAMPDVPTFAEAGSPLPEMDLGTWWGLFGPAGLPRNVVAKLNESLVKAQKAPDVLARLAVLNMDPMISTPEAFAEVINTAIDTWAQVLKRMNIKVD